MKRHHLTFSQLFILISFLCSLCASEFVSAQDTITVTPTKDAMINYAAPTTNYGSYQYFVTEASPGKMYVSLIEFPLSAVPSGAYVTSAKIVLQGTGGHLSSGNSNKSYLRKVTSSWEENAVTWNTKPSTTTADQVVLDESTSSDQNYEVDVTLHIRDMLLNGGNYGFALGLVTGAPTARMEFASSDYSTSSARPKVEIIYEIPDPLVLKPASFGVSCSSTSSGAVDLVVEGGIAPYTYAWSDVGQGSWTTQNINGLTAGDYSVTVTDALNAQSTTTVGVGVAVQLVANGNLSFADQTGSLNSPCDRLYQDIVKSGTSSWTEGQLSDNTLKASTDGWVEYTIDANDQKRMFGLSEIGEANGNWTTMTFGFYMNGSGSLIAIENGTQHSPALGTYQEGDVLRITRTSTGISFEQNGTQVHSIASEVNYFDYTDELAVDVNLYEPGSNLSGLRASFDNPIRVLPEMGAVNSSTGQADLSVVESCYINSYSFTLSDGTATSFTSSDLVGAEGVKYSALPSGDYELEVSRSGYTRPKKFAFSTRNDADINWELNEVYDFDGNLVGASKSYFDQLGRTVQQQQKNLSDGDVIATQTVFDERGRPVLSTLPAPMFTSDFNFRPQFISDVGGNPYDFNTFNKKITTSNALGEVNNPKKVDHSTKGTVGWYYSDLNNSEQRVATTDFPYHRVEYDEVQPGAVKRNASSHNQLRMGMGRETAQYTMPAAGELKHVYGFSSGWVASGFDTITSSGCDGLRNDDFMEHVLVTKTITVDAEGKERVSFQTNEGWLIATAYSGKADNGLNAETYDVQNVLRPDMQYVDIHLPEGCENTLQIVLPSGYQYDILNLATNTFEYQTSSISTPDLDPGFYRIINSHATPNTAVSTTANIYVKYNLNYYDYSLNYHDKAGRVIATVPPLGVDLYKPKWTYNDRADDASFVLSTSSGISSWGLGTVGVDELSIGITAANSTHPNHYNILTFYLDQGTTISGKINKENTDKSTESLVTDTDAKTVSAEAVFYQYESGAALEAPENCSCDSGAICISATSFLAAKDLVKNHCPNQYDHLEDMGNDQFCLTCKDTAQQDVKQYEIDLQLIQTNGEDEVVVKEQTVIVTEYNAGWQIESATAGANVESNIPGSASFGFRLEDGETAPSLALKVAGVRASEPLLENGLWDGSSRKTTLDLSGLQNITLRNKTLSYYLNADPEHNLYSLFYYNFKNELVSDETPDEGKTEYLYSAEGYVRFSQNEKQKAQSDRYTYYSYDQAGRLIENGEYDPGDTPDYFFQNYAFAPSLITGANSVNDPEVLEEMDFSVITGSLVNLTASQRKDPTFILYDTKDADFTTETSLTTANGYCQRFLRGRVSKSWVADNALSTTAPRSISWYSYFPDGEVDWMVQKVNYINNGSKVFTTHYEYDAAKNVSRVIFQKDVSDEYFEHRYTYDADQRLSKVETRTGTSQPWKEQAEYDYYRHGPLKRTELADNVQGIDYIYNTMGWLKAINSPNLGYDGCDQFEDPGADGHGSSAFATDVFGMTLDYFNYDYERKNSNVNFGAYYAANGMDGDMNNWDGKIKSVRWKLQGDDVSPSNDANWVASTSEKWMEGYDDHWMYTYTYNAKNWLEQAEFGTYLEGAQNHRNPLINADHFPFQFLANMDDDYKVSGIDYDANGNIQHLNRTAYELSGTNRMDELTYHYKSCSNQLDYIADTYVGSNWNFDLDNQSSGNYVYNEIGQLEEDNTTGKIVEQTYDAYGNVLSIKKNGTTQLLFTYDSKGNRLSKKTYDSGGGLVATFWYINDGSGNTTAIYKEAASDVDKIEQPIYGSGQIGVYYDQSPELYLYSISDHLGNVRATVERGKAGNGDAVVSTSSDYYPFGSLIPERNENPEDYRYAYQGQFTEHDAETDWESFELRMYDPRMARWMSKDPYRQYHSPYLAMGNNPISNVDPDGGFTKVGAWLYKLKHGGTIAKHTASNGRAYYTVFNSSATVINGLTVIDATVAVGKYTGKAKGLIRIKYLTKVSSYLLKAKAVVDDWIRAYDRWNKTNGMNVNDGAGIENVDGGKRGREAAPIEPPEESRSGKYKPQKVKNDTIDLPVWQRTKDGGGRTRWKRVHPKDTINGIDTTDGSTIIKLRR